MPGDQGRSARRRVWRIMGLMRRWQTIRAALLERHVHEEAYAALLLGGSYEEAGDRGRFRVKAGDVVFHEPFEAHLDRFPQSGAVVLNLRLPDALRVTGGIARVEDLDAVVRAAEKNCKEAVELICCSAMVEERVRTVDWPDALAAALLTNPSLRLSRWGQENGIAPWALSRGFFLVFGISPEAFRARVRARQAFHAIRDTQESLSGIAAELGFADQSHMTRSVKLLTGTVPQAWRRAANGFKTGSRLVV